MNVSDGHALSAEQQANLSCFDIKGWHVKPDGLKEEKETDTQNQPILAGNEATRPRERDSPQIDSTRSLSLKNADAASLTTGGALYP